MPNKPKIELTWINMGQKQLTGRKRIVGTNIGLPEADITNHKLYDNGVKRNEKLDEYIW